jgi:NAD(P)-dependent dehydrogenase (short-subunit alcohol dehydrogenase family)
MADKGIFDLSGRVALVTAGGHGLGREYCEAMAEFGADVVCSDINLERAQETVKQIKRFGHKALAIECDVSKPDDVNLMVKQTLAEFHTIDILFSNAGIPNKLVKLHEIAVEDWERVMAVNLRGMFLCMRAVLPIMQKQKKGSIITTSSVAGLSVNGESFLNASPYGASKAGVIGLTKHVAVEYAKVGIRVNTIAPGVHRTGVVELAPEKLEQMENQIVKFIPMGRLASPIEIRGLAVYLASDASSYVTGQVFVEDGGLTT